MIKKHGNYHIVLQDVQTDIAEQIRLRPDIALSFEYGDINTDADGDYPINDKSVALGLMFHYLIYATIVVTHFGGGWKIPFSTIAVILLLVSASCAAAVHAPAKRIRSMAITDTINEL